ncbi:MAG: sugar ABC transporter permease [Clostridiales bacterium]|jgi:ABC-type sugar transport system permease subunit|nr:sugar ABC transporter permease [Clostridiales bacterium]
MAFLKKTKTGKQELGVVKERKRGASLQAKKSRAGWLFIAPFLLGFLLIYIPIIFDSIKYSFHEIDIITGGGFELVWVGLGNYQAALSDAKFVETLWTGLGGLIVEIPAILLFSLFIALLLNQKMAGRAAFRAIFFIPVLLTTGLIADIDAGNMLGDYMGSDSSGIDTGGAGGSGVAEILSATDLQNLFNNMIVGSELAANVTKLVNNIFDIVNRSGVQMLIFLAGLQGISPAIYESCEIEGASSWETFWKITLPIISPMILVNAIYTVIDSFTSGNNSVMAYVNELYKTAGDGNVISSAMAWMYFLLVMLVVAAVAGIISLFVFYQRKD